LAIAQCPCPVHIYFYHTAYIEVFVQGQHFQGQCQWSFETLSAQTAK